MGSKGEDDNNSLSGKMGGKGGKMGGKGEDDGMGGKMGSNGEDGGSCAMLFVRTDRIYFAKDTLSVPFCAHVINLKRRKRYGRLRLKMSLLPTQAIYCMHGQGTPPKTTGLLTALQHTSRCMHRESFWAL